MVVDKEKCVGCGTCCNDLCPVGAITLNGDKAEINQELCINCGACAGACPVEAIN